MFWYPVQRHRLPDRAQRTSSSVGSGLASRSALAVIIMPGVQNPHCSPCSSLKPSCSGCSSLAVARPSTVEISCPSAWTASIVHDFTAFPSTRTVHAPQLVVSQPMCVPVSPSPRRMRWDSSSLGSTSAILRSPLIVNRIRRTGTSLADASSLTTIVMSGRPLCRALGPAQDAYDERPHDVPLVLRAAAVVGPRLRRRGREIGGALDAVGGQRSPDQRVGRLR